MTWWRKISGWFHRKSIDTELQEEIRLHLELRAAEHNDPQAAHRRFGNTTLLLEDARSVWGWPRIESWLRDFRYALRVVIRRPAFAAAVIATLALGIGASSTIFSLIDAVLIRPLPYPAGHRLVSLREARPGDERGRTPISPGRVEDWNRMNSAFDAIAGSYADTLTDTTGPIPERIPGAFVSPRFFSVLGTAPALGRVFTAQEEGFGGPLAIVISDAFWRQRFAGDPGVLGRTMILGGQSWVIAGVMPAAFQYPSPDVAIWAPKQARPGLLQIREARFYDGIGRMRPGVTPEQAQADLAAVQKQLGERYPKTDAGWTAAVEPLKDQLIGRVRFVLWFLLASVSVLLLIACANVACLLLARLNSRAAEIATRRSLGASRAAIARQLFAEGLIYAAAGGLLGMAGAFAATGLLRNRVSDIPRIAEMVVDARMLGLGIAISVLAAILFSLAPVLQTFRQDLTASLTRGGRSVAAGRQRLPRTLVAAQLGLATTLLIGAGLFLRSLTLLQETPLGFHPDHVLAVRVGATFSEAPDAVAQRHQRTLDALSSIPGVTAVAMSTGLPGANATWPREFEIQGEPAPGGTLRFASWRIVTAAYFQTLGIPVLEGRTCRMSTDPQTPFETLVNRSFAERYFRGRDPIGHSLIRGPQGQQLARIVGVVADAHEDSAAQDPQPLIYGCGFLRFWPDSDFLIQTRDPAAIAAAVRIKIRSIEPSRPVYAVRPLEQALGAALSQTRFRTLLISLFSFLALTLSSVGLYGVMAYMVSQRTREIGIRMALGARPQQILAEILRAGGTLAACGAATGIALAAIASRLMGGLLYGIAPSDPATYLSAIGVLFGVALLACIIPGRRAISIDPTEALRES